MRPRISIKGFVRRSVHLPARRSVRPLVGPSICRLVMLLHRCIPGYSLDASSHLYKRVCSSVGLLVHLPVDSSVRRSVSL